MSKPPCKRCGGKLPSYRHDGFCSQKCEKAEVGYSEAYLRELDREAVKAGLQASTAWRPLPIEPILHINSALPITVFSDVHCPLHDISWIYQGILTAKKYGSEILIINGDFIDANQISRHIGGYYRRRSELNDDIKAGESLLALLVKHFKMVYFLNGNHCMERLIKAFRGEVAVQQLWKMFGDHPNVKLSSRSFVFVNDTVAVGHPRNYSKLRGSLPQKIAQHWQKHVMLGHGHHSAKAVTSDGKWQAVDIPCLADLAQFEYSTYEINDMPRPMNGFSMIFGDKIMVFDKFSPYKMLGIEEVFEEKAIPHAL
jgi:hypothetical protein